MCVCVCVCVCLYIYIYIYIYIKSDIIRRKTTMFLILQDMFRIHHPSSVAKSELKSLEHI